MRKIKKEPPARLPHVMHAGNTPSRSPAAFFNYYYTQIFGKVNTYQKIFGEVYMSQYYISSTKYNLQERQTKKHGKVYDVVSRMLHQNEKSLNFC